MTETTPAVLYGANSSFAVQTFLSEHLRFFSSRGYRVSVVLPNCSEPRVISEPAGVSEHRVTMRREISPATDILSIIQLWRLLRRTRPVLVNMTTPKMGFLGIIAAVLAGTPVRVYTLRGLRLETTSGLKRRLLTWAEYVACSLSSVVICISESLRTRAIELGVVDASKAIVISTKISEGVALAEYLPSEANATAASLLRKKLGVDGDAFIFGFIGRLTRDKGLYELVNAFRAVKMRGANVRLVLAGDFESGDPVRQSVRDDIKADPEIISLGFVHPTAPIYHILDALVLPTYREGLGRVLLEAAAAGKPVISTLTTGVVDVVKDGVTGLLVPPRDTNALANAMHRLASSREFSRSLGNEALKTALAEFDGGARLCQLDERYCDWISRSRGTFRRGAAHSNISAENE